MPVLDGTSLVQFNQGLFTIFSSFYNLQKLRAEQKIGSINFLLCFLNGRWSSISELVAVPILRMLEIAYIAKQVNTTIILFSTLRSIDWSTNRMEMLLLRKVILK